jgi:hypothetical protein
MMVAPFHRDSLTTCSECLHLWKTYPCSEVLTCDTDLHKHTLSIGSFVASDDALLPKCCSDCSLR